MQGMEDAHDDKSDANQAGCYACSDEPALAPSACGGATSTGDMLEDHLDYSQ